MEELGLGKDFCVSSNDRGQREESNRVGAPGISQIMELGYN